MPRHRSTALASAIFAPIAACLRFVPHECGVASITSVQVSHDLEWVTVGVSSLTKPELALLSLKKSIPQIREGIARQIQLRRIPKIRFFIDQGPAIASHMDVLLAE